MDTATRVRTAYFSKLADKYHPTYGYGMLTFDGVDIPIFDEFVNPNAVLPKMSGANEVYIILQDQQEFDNAIQTVCNYRLISNMTVRVITTWSLTGSKKLCEDIANEIDNRLRQRRDTSKLTGITKIELELSRSISEQTQSNTAFNKIMIYRNYINK